MSTRSVKAIVGIAVASAFALGACSPPVKEVPDPQSEQSGQAGAQSEQQSGSSADSELGPVVLTDQQVELIVADIQAVLTKAEEDKDAAILKERLVNPALAMRSGQFTRAKKTKTDLAPLELNMSVFSATAGTSFPRVLVIGSEASGDNPAEIFFLTQEDARSDYMLENWTRLIGGTPVKGLSVRDGSKVLGPDAEGLRLTPKETVETYVNYLNSPDNEEYQVFEDNVFAPRYKQELTALNEAIEVAGNVTASAKVGDYALSAVALQTGSALVSAAFTYSHTYTKTVEGATLELAGTPAAYLEDPVLEHAATANYLVTIFFLVPPQDSGDKIDVVGAERVITSVERDDGGDDGGDNSE